MRFSESEEAWIDRRAEKFARELGLTLPIARSEAIAELLRLQRKKKAEVIELKSRDRK